MSKKIFIGLFVFLCLTLHKEANAQPPGTDKKAWQLVEGDDFKFFDTAKWGHGGTPWGSESHDGSCNLQTAEDSYTDSGNLVVRTRKGPIAGPSGKIYPYAASYVWSKAWHTYGYLEIRAQYPNQRGAWPAFWMLGAGWPPEIDIAEFRGDPKNYMTNAYYDGGWSTATPVGDFTGWHKYGLLWEPGSLKYYIDGELTFTVNKSPSVPMYVILSNGVDCGDANDEGYPNYFNVDYFRWYQMVDSSADFSGTYEIINKKSRKSLQTLGGSTADASSVVQNIRDGNPSSLWTINKTSPGVYTMVHNLSGKNADIFGGSGQPGATCIIWPDNGGNNQKWIITKLKNGFYKIKNVNSRLVLDIKDSSILDNAECVQWTANGGRSQQWALVPISDSIVAQKSSEEMKTIEDAPQKQSVILYPNPSNKGHFSIKFDKPSNADIKIIDATGRVVHMQNVSGSDVKINRNLTPGIYIVNITRNKVTTSLKLLVN